MTCPRLITSSPLSILEAVTQYLFVEDGLHPVFREEILLDLEVRTVRGAGQRTYIQ